VVVGADAVVDRQATAGPRVAISPVQGIKFNQALKPVGSDRTAPARI
jgi:hypothetical protein